MKLILSRKGFDSSTGGVPSPIFPDGRMLSLPIASNSSPMRYRHVLFEGESIAPLVKDLTDGRVGADSRVHLDPDIDSRATYRMPGWRPCFGPSGSAHTHLVGHGVSTDDLILFFGWFRHVEHANGKWRYVRSDRSAHILFGWMKIGRIYRFEEDGCPNCFLYHDHVNGDPQPGGVLYTAPRLLSAHGAGSALPGAGLFKYVGPDLVLSAGEGSRSIWHLPEWFYPSHGRRPLSYHTDLKRWKRTEDATLLQSVGRGQEFVLDCDDYPEAEPWLRSLIGTHGS